MEKYIRQCVLAKKLNVKRETVHKWVNRGKINFKTDRLTGLIMVEDINAIPSRKEQFLRGEPVKTTNKNHPQSNKSIVSIRSPKNQ